MKHSKCKIELLDYRNKRRLNIKPQISSQIHNRLGKSSCHVKHKLVEFINEEEGD